MPTPTAEQLAIITYAAENQTQPLVVEALAGTGKTTTIVDLLKKLRGQSLLLAYNKSIQRELESRIPTSLRLSCTVSTVHSFGLGVLRRNGFHKVKIDGGKLHFLFRRLLDSKPSFARHFNERRAGASAIVNLVSHAKNAGFDLVSQPTGTGPLQSFYTSDCEEDWVSLIDYFRIDEELEDNRIPIPAAIEMAQRLLAESNRTESMLDFDDMIYLPLLRNLSIPRNDHVIIDEAQDISPTRAELALRAAASGRLIAVGDRHQAIYGFTGADAHAMQNLIARTGAETLPLTICWRCDEAIITEAQAYVPNIRARPDAGPGSVTTTSITDFLSPAFIIPLGSAILCRLNRPNVAVCLELIRQGIPAKIEGRDLGAALIRHAKKAQPLYTTTPLPDLILDLESYRDAETGSLVRRGKKSAAAYLTDEVDAAILLIERALETGGKSWANFEALVQSLFADDISPRNIVTLSSVHKSKGREWPTVYLLGPDDYMPFWMAEADWEQEQERNLLYVAITRAEQNLIKITGVKSWLDSRNKGPSDSDAILTSGLR